MNQLSEPTPTVAIDRKENNAPRQVFLFSGHMVDASDRSRAFWVKERVRSWHIMPQELGPTPTSEDPFACVNLWMLDQALAYGTRKVSFICLWDRQAGDGPGGTKHLHDAVVQGSGKAYVLDTTQLW